MNPSLWIVIIGLIGIIIICLFKAVRISERNPTIELEIMCLLHKKGEMIGPEIRYELCADPFFLVISRRVFRQVIADLEKQKWVKKEKKPDAHFPTPLSTWYSLTEKGLQELKRQHLISSQAATPA